MIPVTPPPSSSTASLWSIAGMVIPLLAVLALALALASSHLRNELARLFHVGRARLTGVPVPPPAPAANAVAATDEQPQDTTARELSMLEAEIFGEAPS